MAIHTSKFDLHKEALEENLEAVRLLISYQKEVISNKWIDEKGCLGYPAATLLFSCINAFGNLFYDEVVAGVKISSDKKTFQILNSEYFESQNISNDILDELYETYRSKLTHNLSLPKNYFIKLKSGNNNWYETSNNDKGKKIISTVYLQDLHELCSKAYNKIENEHKEKYNGSIKTVYMEKKDLGENWIYNNVNVSGII